jgi:hypothetical protein
MSDAEWTELLEDKRQAIDRLCAQLEACQATVERCIEKVAAQNDEFDRLQVLNAELAASIELLMETTAWQEIPFPLRTRLRGAKDAANRAQSCPISCREGDASREIPGNQAPTD